MLQDTELNSKLKGHHSCTDMYNDKWSVLLFQLFNDFAPYAECFLDFISAWRFSILVCGLQIKTHEGMTVIHSAFKYNILNT